MKIEKIIGFINKTNKNEAIVFLGAHNPSVEHNWYNTWQQIKKIFSLETLLVQEIESPNMLHISITMPSFVTNRLERLQWNFFWGGQHDEVKFHLVDWNFLCGGRSLPWSMGRIGGWWPTKRVNCTHGCSLWSSIRTACDTVLNYVQVEVGDGNRTRFWKHKWCGNLSLEEAFPELYEI